MQVRLLGGWEPPCPGHPHLSKRRRVPDRLTPIEKSSEFLQNVVPRRVETIDQRGTVIDDASQITRLLRASTRGDRAAHDELIPLVYAELRSIARGQLSRERADHTLNPTALVHEAYLRLARLDRLEWQDRSHFYAIAARAMRNLLVDHALRRKRAKRGGGVPDLPLDAVGELPGVDPEQVLAVDSALTALEERNSRHARIVELRFFTGLTIEETAAALDISPATVKRDWLLLRAWLARELEG